jgi:hypothetical protein
VWTERWVVGTRRKGAPRAGGVAPPASQAEGLGRRAPSAGAVIDGGARGLAGARVSAACGPFLSARLGLRGLRRAGRVSGLVSGFDLIKITMPSYVVQTLQEMVSPDPQIIVVAPGAEPVSTQVQRTEDGGTIVRIFWVGPKGELLRRTPVSSVMQVGFEIHFPPCSFLPSGHNLCKQAQCLAQIRLGPVDLLGVPHLAAAEAAQGSRAAPGGARDQRAAQGAVQPAPPAWAGGGCALRSRQGIFLSSPGSF